MKTKARCIDICFSDRYSFSVIDALAVKDLSDENLEMLAGNFVNDAYTMNQNACSSPHLIVWINGDESGRNRFWSGVRDIVDKRIQFSGSKAFEKYNNFCECAVNLNIKDFFNHKNLLYVMKLDKLQRGLELFRGKDGAFFEYFADDFSENFKNKKKKYQTITYFCMDPKLICNSMSKYGSLRIDLIVPIGKALDMTYIWDGFDTIRSLSRVVNIE